MSLKKNTPLGGKSGSVLKIGKRTFAYGTAPLDSTVRAYWNSVLLTSVALADTSEGTFYVEPREKLDPEEIHTLILVAENSDNPDIKSKPLVIKFRIKRGISPWVFVLIALALIAGGLGYRHMRKKPQVSLPPSVQALIS